MAKRVNPKKLRTDRLKQRPKPSTAMSVEQLWETYGPTEVPGYRQTRLAMRDAFYGGIFAPLEQFVAVNLETDVGAKWLLGDRPRWPCSVHSEAPALPRVSGETGAIFLMLPGEALAGLEKAIQLTAPGGAVHCNLYTTQDVQLEPLVRIRYPEIQAQHLGCWSGPLQKAPWILTLPTDSYRAG